MPTITISSVDYNSNAEVADADDYLAADFTATGWQAETSTDKKARALITATRILDRVDWPGSKTDDDQLGAWPRTGTGIDGVDEDEIPTGIVNATIELGRFIYDGSTVGTEAQPDTNKIKRQKAGSVEIEYISPALLSEPSRFPLPVQELIAPFLGSTGFAGAISHGTDGCSVADDSFRPGFGA